MGATGRFHGIDGSGQPRHAAACVPLGTRYARGLRHSGEAGVNAIPLFEQAIALDPNYAEAHRWLALGQSIGWLHMNRPMDLFRRLSMASAKKEELIASYQPRDYRGVVAGE